MCSSVLSILEDGFGDSEFEFTFVFISHTLFNKERELESISQIFLQ